MGILGWALHAFLKVQAGEGLDYYISGKGIQFSYIGVLILFLVIPVALAGGWLVGKILVWREGTLKKREIAERRLAKLSKMKSGKKRNKRKPTGKKIKP